MKRFNWKNILWIIIEILISLSLYYSINWVLKNTEFPFTDDMLGGLIILLMTLGISYGLAIYAFIKIDESISNLKLNIEKGTLFLAIGTVGSIFIMNLLDVMDFLGSEFPSFLFVLIIITISVLSLNFGLRMNETMPNNV